MRSLLYLVIVRYVTTSLSHNFKIHILSLRSYKSYVVIIKSVRRFKVIIKRKHVLPFFVECIVLAVENKGKQALRKGNEKRGKREQVKQQH